MRRLHGNLVIMAHLPVQRRLPFWPRDRIEAHRDARVRRIVAHAASTVPYYRDLFARERIDPREVRGESISSSTT
jgi:phenylacetate-coenzyme A ligase PaaK-like adenylate-forming protein